MNMAMSKNIQAIILILIASFTFSALSIISGKMVSINAVQFFFLSNVVAALILIISFPLLGKKFPVTNSTRSYLARALLNALGMIMWCDAVKLVPATDAMSISYFAPILNISIAILFLKEKPKAHSIVPLIGGLVGMFLIVRPGMMEANTAHYLLLLTMIAWSCCDIITKLHSKVDSAITQCFYMIIFTPLVLLPFVYFYLEIPNWVQLMWVVIFAIIYVINSLAYFRAYSLANLVTILPFNFTRLIFTAIFAYVFFGEVISLWTLTGALIIIVVSLYGIRQEARFSV